MKPITIALTSEQIAQLTPLMAERDAFVMDVRSRDADETWAFFAQVILDAPLMDIESGEDVCFSMSALLITGAEAKEVKRTARAAAKAAGARIVPPYEPMDTEVRTMIFKP